MLNSSSIKDIEKIFINKNTIDSNIICSVCLESESFANNAIVLCDICNVAVHQICYGSPLTNELP